MENPTFEPVRGRLANVTALLFVDASTSEAVCRDASDRLRVLFEDVMWVGPGAAQSPEHPTAGERDESALAALAAAFEAAREDRVLVVDPALAVPAAVWLGLCAWPEHPVVTARIGGALQPLCAVYQRDAAATCAHALVAAGESEPARLIAELEAGVLEGDDIAPLLVD